MKRFPIYERHMLASCFNCGNDLDGGYWRDSGNAPGRGQFVQDCCKCGMATYYDIRGANRGFRDRQCARTHCIHRPGEPLPGVVCLGQWDGSIPNTGTFRCFMCGQPMEASHEHR